MKINKLFLGLLGLSAMVMASCSDSDDYQWATITGGDQVYFSNELPTQQNLSMSDTEFTIPVSRVNTSGATTVNISLTSDDNFLSAPTSVSFNAGESVANLKVSYNPEALGYDNYKKAELKITDEGQTNVYGYSTYSFTAGIPSPYKNIGKGVYADNYYFEKSVTVTIMQNQEKKNTYRIMAPYKNITGGGDDYLELTILKPGDMVGNVTITLQDLVLFKSFNTGYHHPDYDADVMFYHPSVFTKYQDEAAWLYSKVIGYKEDGTPGQIQLAPFYYMDGVGGWNASQSDGNVIITFPGYAPKDLSADTQYLGVLTDADGAASAAINLTLGEDVVDARALVVSADADPEAVADAIAAGDVEGYPVVAGNNFVPIEEGLTGKLMVVVAILDEGALKGVYSTIFEYYGGAANPWKSRGIGLLTDNLFITMYSPDGQVTYDPMTFEVEVLENTDSPGLYRLVNPFQIYGDAISYMDFTPTNLDINATDPDAVYIDFQATGIDDGDGMTYICSYGGYMLQQYDFADLKEYGYFGTLADGVITLPSFPVKDDDGSVLYTYQGIFAQGTKAYYTGMNTEFKLVLPEAVPSSARAKARAQAKARTFEKNLKSFDCSKKVPRSQTNRNAPLVRNLELMK